MSAPDEVAARVRSMLVRALELSVAPEDIDPQAPLFGAGLDGDSIAALEVVAALEAEFGIEVSDEELQVEILDSAAALTRFVEQKLQAGATDGDRG